MERPKVGVSVIIWNEDKVLLGIRKSAHGAGTLAFPGGHLEYGESVFDCAKREVLEETGLQISQLSVGPYTNDVFEEEGKHYITLFVIAKYEGGEAKAMEPEKCEAWKWFAWESLPSPLFLPIENLLKLNAKVRLV